MKNALLDPVLELESYNKILELLKKDSGYPKTAICTGVIDSQKSHLAWAYGAHCQRPFVVITHSELKAREIYDDLRFFMGDGVKLYPARDIVFYSADVRSAEVVKQRFDIINSFLAGKNPAVVLSVEALFDCLTPPNIFMENIMHYKTGDELNVDSFAEKLVMLGYERVDIVEGPGHFSIRGGIIDVYTTVYENAIRIELWGDEIDSIRFLDAFTQRSVEKVESFSVFPMRELVYNAETLGKAIKSIEEEYLKLLVSYKQKKLVEESETLTENILPLLEKLREKTGFSGVDKYISYFYENSASFFDYIPKNSLLFFDEPSRIAQHAENVSEEFTSSMQNRIMKGYLLPGQTDCVFSYQKILSSSQRFSRILFTTLTHSVRDFAIHETASFQVKSSGVAQKKMELLESELKYFIEQNYRIILLAGGKTRAERLFAEFRDRGMNVSYIEDLDNAVLEKGKVFFHRGSLSKGFEYSLIGLNVISGREIFDGDNKKKKAKRVRKKGAKIESFTDLRVGDYVVHDNHGIGIYRGIEKITVDNISRDYLKISYKDGGNLYISTNEMDVLQKFIGGDEAKPKLNKLGGGEWSKAKSRVKSAVSILAKDLVELYAKREAAKGFVYSPDTVWQAEFEETFPYEETDDQLNAIADVKKDMESSKVMDRLVCGDVGYGKTEIAIRAAFKAVGDGKQVAYLVPTTILAQQHYNTFTQRMKDFPVNIDLLSRFRTPKQQKETIKKIKFGGVDIVIGTHRLLSSDLEFSDLGLIIVDEEQRFGVSHKEKLKRLRENLEVLTLTATPIPRTLHMSLTGIRDLSILEEPPEERQPIQTYVMEYNPEIVRDAINRERAREGQVYYLHNRVRNISEVAAKIQQLVPNATVAFAHGQMSEHELENVMMDFIEGNIDVLVCTTIIETGLDIPNVNTIIIQDADYMGLSQLYQLRGRVGRSSRSSYAYLMYKRDKVLTENSEKRLQTIREFTEFGSGFKIAMRDLEIRGAGNLLGAEQHGYMDSVGYDMYCKLLYEAVNEFKGDEMEEVFETLIDINVNAFIPPYYIEDELQKLEIYKKISLIRSRDDYGDIIDEITDRFGDLPTSVVNLLNIALLKATAHSLGAVSVTQKHKSIVVNFRKNATADPVRIAEVVAKSGGTLLFTLMPVPYLTYKLLNDGGAGFIEDLNAMLEKIIAKSELTTTN